ncbi:Gfo/Idh/MocA family oxidoreductase [Halalkalibaculum sp. DA3122]|uniref:Gfo/Idh/MocA family protein n=1 Tax=unclassified Halalkalibaculum TaxID=2964617 RepID=UPI003754F93C
MKDTKNNASKNQSSISRKDFLNSSALAAAGFFFVPRHVLGGPGYKAPSDRLNIACIGVGGMGGSNTRSLSELGENIYALCDVDEEYAAETLYSYPKAKKYVDFREMLDKEQEIDAVMVATPDNTHAAIAIYAMKLGKHAFVQKPLTRTIYEARRMAEVAEETGVVTQMGNQGHCFEGTYQIVDYIRQGVIGTVEKVDCWTNRPRGYWPQGSDVQPLSGTVVTPYTMHWDLWVGPSPYRPYDPNIAPFAWRGRWDFGAGALGDMGAHILDQPYWALNLGMPESVHASSTPFNSEAFPLGSMVNYKFPARGDLPPVDLTWYDGGLTPPRPAELAEGEPLGSPGGGMIFYGSEGMLMADVYGNNPRFIPASFGNQVGSVKQTVDRAAGIHEEWVAACKGNGSTSSHFGYAARLTETMLVGNMAIRFSDRDLRLQWDSENMKVPNLEDANTWLDQRNDFRTGYREIIG